MTEQLQIQVSKILEMMISGLEKAGALGVREFPGLVEDYLTMHLIQEMPIWSTLAFLLSLFLIYKTKKWSDQLVKNDPDIEPSRLALIFPIALLIGSCSQMNKDIKEVVKIKMAPKAYLIEKLRQ